MFICKEISYVMQYLHLFSPFKCNHFNKLVLLRKKDLQSNIRITATENIIIYAYLNRQALL